MVGLRSVSSVEYHTTESNRVGCGECADLEESDAAHNVATDSRTWIRSEYSNAAVIRR